MKILKIRIRRGDVGENMMIYPVGYSAEQVDREGVYAVGLPVQDALSGGIGLGDAQEWGLIAMNDAVAAQYDADPDMEIVTETEANTLLADWRADRLTRGAHGEQEERITNQGTLDLIREKRDARISLSAREMAALDPDNDELGINSGPRKVPLRVTARLA